MAKASGAAKVAIVAPIKSREAIAFQIANIDAPLVQLDTFRSRCAGCPSVAFSQSRRRCPHGVISVGAM